MEYELLEHCVMALADSLRRWMMHRVSSFIKTKWYNQNTPTRDTHLDKVITPCCFSLKLIFFPLSLLSCTSLLTSWLLANTMIWFSMLTLLTQGEDLDIVFFYQTDFFKIVFVRTNRSQISSPGSVTTHPRVSRRSSPRFLHGQSGVTKCEPC